MPDSNNRGGVPLDIQEEDRISGKGTLAKIGRDQQYTSEEARAQGAVTGECGNPAGGDPANIGQSPAEARRDSNVGRTPEARDLQDRLIEHISSRFEGHKGDVSPEDQDILHPRGK